MKFLLLIISVATLFIVFFISLSKDPSYIPSNLIDEQIPEFNLTKISNKINFSDSDLKKKNIKIVNFFASWCPPCEIEHPQLSELSKKKNIKLFGINKKDNEKDLNKFLSKLGDPFSAIGSDPVGRASIDWGVYGLPETFLIDKNGIIRYKHVGPIMKRDLNVLEKILDKLLNE